MGGGASKTTARRCVDRVIVVDGAKVYAAALPAGGTLREARAVIAADRDDPDDPLAGVPRAFRFVVGGVRVAKRSEGDRRVRDSLTDGETLVLADADVDAGEAEAINTEAINTRRSCREPRSRTTTSPFVAFPLRPLGAFRFHFDLCLYGVIWHS